VDVGVIIYSGNMKQEQLRNSGANDGDGIQKWDTTRFDEIKTIFDTQDLLEEKFLGILKSMEETYHVFWGNSQT
jgi:hypothetical protein